MKRKVGRPKGSIGKNNGVRFTPTVKRDILDWINKQPMSQGKAIEKLVKDVWEKVGK